LASFKISGYVTDWERWGCSKLQEVWRQQEGRRGWRWWK